MSNAPGRQKDRVGYQVCDQYQRYAKAITLRAANCSWGQIATRLGYESRSGAEHAVWRGLDQSMLIPGLRVVMHDRLDRFWARLEPLEAHATNNRTDEFVELLGLVHLTTLRIGAAIGHMTSPAGLRDVAGLIARRNPHPPRIDEQRRDERLLLRGLAATLDMMHCGYANRSGIHKAVERDLRRLLLEAAVTYYQHELADLRCLWHEIELAIRRRPIHTALISAAFTELIAVLDQMTVFDLPATPRSSHPDAVLNPWVSKTQHHVSN